MWMFVLGGWRQLPTVSAAAVAVVAVTAANFFVLLFILRCLDISTGPSLSGLRLLSGTVTRL